MVNTDLHNKIEVARSEKLHFPIILRLLELSCAKVLRFFIYRTMQK
jgi:hypothetical protein